MLARALIVLLVVLNLGVAAWWMARGDAAIDDAPAPQPEGIARLQLLREVPRARAPRPKPVATASAASAEAAPAAAQSEGAPAAAQSEGAPAQERCYAIGPFADPAAGEAARKALQARVLRLRVRAVPAPSPDRGWRVWLPPQADRAAAQAVAGRIAAGGFDDYYIVASGDEANSIALGRYGSEASARRRADALHAAGFPDVRADPLGDAPASATWIDVASAVPLAAADARALGAKRLEAADCGTVPAAG